jgi:7-carboxy-7-deazaguanine synthase
MQVIEKFVSINGEGLKQGELALFIRFANCNLRCSYCDTKYSFINPEFTNESIDEIVEYAKSKKIKNITLTGGEPLIQDGIKELIIKLANNNFNIEIETNGSVSIKEFLNIPNVSFTLDYKLPVSLMEKYMDFSNYEFVTKKDSVKFVCGNLSDMERAYEIIKKYNLIEKTNCLFSPIFNMIDLKEMVNFLIDNNLNGVRLCLQIHKIIWDPSERGV